MADSNSKGFRVRGWVLLAIVLIVTGLLGIIVGVLTVQYDLSLHSLFMSSQGTDQVSLTDAWRRYSSNWISAGFRIGLVAIGLLTVLYGFRGERRTVSVKSADQVA